MCLAMPVRVVELLGDASGEALARVDLGGVRKEVSLALVDDVRVGDYVILHAGYALSVLDTEEAERTLALFAEIGAPGIPETPGQAGAAGTPRRA